MPLGMEVGLGPSDIMLDGDPARGVATAGPRAPYHAPYIKMTIDSLSSQLTFDE